jgi:hypothetical protein
MCYIWVPLPIELLRFLGRSEKRDGFSLFSTRIGGPVVPIMYTTDRKKQHNTRREYIAFLSREKACDIFYRG